MWPPLTNSENSIGSRTPCFEAKPASEDGANVELVLCTLMGFALTSEDGLVFSVILLLLLPPNTVMGFSLIFNLALTSEKWQENKLIKGGSQVGKNVIANPKYY